MLNSDITFVVPTRNSEKTLKPCLNSLLDQVGVVSEVIVVDNYSTDNTTKIASNLGATVILAGPERCVQRNVGAAAANSPVVAFIDSDMVATPRIGSQAVTALEENLHYAGLVIPEYSFGQGFWAQCRALEKKLYLEDKSVEAARIYRIDELIAAGGWDETLVSGEDWELSDRMLAFKKLSDPTRAAMGRISVFIGHDEGKLKLRDTFVKKRYYGSHLGNYLVRKPKGSQHLLRTSLLKPELLSEPIHGAGLVVLKTTEVVGIFSGMISARKHMKDTEVVPHPGPITVAHLIGEYSVHEGMGRTLNEVGVLLEKGIKIDGQTVCVKNKIITPHVLAVGDITNVIETGGSTSTGLFTNRKSLTRLLKDVDIIHVHGGPFAPGLAAALHLDKPTVVSVYATPTLPSGSQWRTIPWKHWRASNAASTRVLASHMVGTKALKMGLKALDAKAVLTADKRVASVTTSCPTYPYTAGSTHTNTSIATAFYQTKAPSLVFLGRAELVRGLDIFLDAFKELKNTHPSLTARLLLLPAGDLDTILQLCQNHPYSSSIEITTSAVNVYEKLANSTVGVWAFRSDYVTSPPSLAALEALATGLPIVASDVVCLRGLFKNTGGWGKSLPGNPGALVRPGSTQDVVSAVDELLSNQQLWEHASSNAKEYAKVASWENVAKTTAAAYLSALPKYRK